MKFIFGFFVGVLTLISTFIAGIFAGRIEIIPRQGSHGIYYRRFPSYGPAAHGHVNYEGLANKEAPTP